MTFFSTCILGALGQTYERDLDSRAKVILGYYGFDERQYDAENAESFPRVYHIYKSWQVSRETAQLAADYNYYDYCKELFQMIFVALMNELDFLSKEYTRIAPEYAPINLILCDIELGVHICSRKSRDVFLHKCPDRSTFEVKLRYWSSIIVTAIQRAPIDGEWRTHYVALAGTMY